MADTQLFITPYWGPMAFVGATPTPVETLILGVLGPQGNQGPQGPQGVAGATEEEIKAVLPPRDELFDWRSLPGLKFFWDARATTYFSDTVGTTPVTNTGGANVQRAEGRGPGGTVIPFTKAGDQSPCSLININGLLALTTTGTMGLNYTAPAGNVAAKTWYVVFRENARTNDSRLINLGGYAPGSQLGLITWRDIKYQFQWEGGVDSSNDVSSAVQTPTQDLDSSHIKVACGTWGDPGTGVKVMRLAYNGVPVLESTANKVQGTLPEGTVEGYRMGYRGTPACFDYLAFGVYDAYHTHEQMARTARGLLQAFSTQNANYRTDPVVIWSGASNLADVNTTNGASFPALVNLNSTSFQRDFLQVWPGMDISTIGPMVEENLGRVRQVYDRTGKNLYVLNGGGGNDFRNLTDSTAQLLARWERMVQGLKRHDPQAYVHVMTYLPGAGYDDARRIALNNALVANARGLWDGTSAIHTNAQVGLPGTNVPPNYHPDNIHLTDAGAAIIAGVLQAEVEAALASMDVGGAYEPYLIEQQVEMNLVLPAPVNGEFPLVPSSRFSTTLKGLYGLKVSSGSLTLTVRINGVDVTGLANLNVTTAPQTATATAANVLPIGGRLTLVISGVAGGTTGFETTLGAMK